MGFKNQVEPKRLTSWTASKLSLYESCPAKAKYKHIDKLPDEGGPALERGTEIHNAAEKYITSRTKTLHPDLKHPKIKKLLDTLRKDYKKKKVRTELELAFTKEWQKCHWLAKDVWVRFKMDCVHFLAGGKAHVIDWKTGKFKPDGEYDDQLSAYAVGLLVSGLAESVTAQLVFTDAGEIVTREAGTLTLADLPKAKLFWVKKTKAMLSDTRFPARPGNGCRYCPYSANKGGPCEF
jgi:hypothetical protein